MAAAAILDFCTVLILTVNLIAGLCFHLLYQIRCKYMQQWPTYGQTCNFQYGGWISWDINFAGKTSYGTSFLVSVLNMVRIR